MKYYYWSYYYYYTLEHRLGHRSYSIGLEQIDASTFYDNIEEVR